jgi:hypothetical protein
MFGRRARSVRLGRVLRFTWSSCCPHLTSVPPQCAACPRPRPRPSAAAAPPSSARRAVLAWRALASRCAAPQRCVPSSNRRVRSALPVHALALAPVLRHRLSPAVPKRAHRCRGLPRRLQLSETSEAAPVS